MGHLLISGSRVLAQQAAPFFPTFISELVTCIVLVNLGAFYCGGRGGADNEAVLAQFSNDVDVFDLSDVLYRAFTVPDGKASP